MRRAFARISSASSSTVTNRSAGPPMRNEVNSASDSITLSSLPEFPRSSLFKRLLMRFRSTPSSAQQLIAELIDVAGAERQHHIAGASSLSASLRAAPFHAAEIVAP